MRNLKLALEYDGTNYAGWQIQKSRKQKTIQETVEKALAKILQENIRLVGSGRTDAGVHALAQVANFKTNSDIAVKKLQVALNGLLPDDIVVSKIKEVDSSFHSRFSAKAKVYRYTILNRAYSSALLKDKVYFFRHRLNIRRMREEAKVLLGRHNFKAFQASTDKDLSPVRTIKSLKITRNKDLVYIDIKADGFLYNMARNIVGTLIEVGRGKFKRGELKKILLSKDRRLAGPTAPARGLCLVEVKY